MLLLVQLDLLRLGGLLVLGLGLLLVLLDILLGLALADKFCELVILAFLDGKHIWYSVTRIQTPTKNIGFGSSHSIGCWVKRQ